MTTTKKDTEASSKPKYKYIREFEIRASVKILFPYLSTAAGLAEWLAEDVSLDADKRFNFVWDGESHIAKMTSMKSNGHVKFEFLPVSEADKKSPSYLEFKLDHNEITDASYLKVIDYSEIDDKEELDVLWEQLIDSLKEKVGG